MEASNRSGLLLAAALLASAACSDPEAAKRGYFDAGTKYMAEGKVAEAIIEFRNAVRWDAQFGEAHLKLAEAYEQSQNRAAAFREYVRAADLLPNDAETQVKVGAWMLAAGEFEDARSRADRALALEPQRTDALILRANAMSRLRDVSGAIDEMEKAVAAQPGQAGLYTSLGALRLADGQAAEAEAAFRQAVGVAPESVDAHLALAYFYWSTGRHAEVESTLKKTLELQPASRPANRLLAILYLATRRPAEAEAPLKAYAAAAGETGALMLADYYRQMERASEAAAILNPMLESRGAYRDAALRLADLERAAGRHHAAAKILDDFLKRDPRNTMGLIARAQWDLEDGRPADALAAARAAVEGNPVSPLAQFALANALIRNRQNDEAIQALTETLRRAPNMVNARVLLARAHLAMGRSGEALQTILSAKKVAPENPDVREVLARSLILQGQASQAVPEVRALLASHPHLPSTQELNGMLMVAQGNRDAARAAFGRALERDPNSVQALNALLAMDIAAKNVAPSVARIERTLAGTREDVDLMFVAARTYVAAAQHDKLERTLRSILEIEPNHLDSYLMLGRLYALQNRLDQALGEFDTAGQRRDSIAAKTMAAIIVHMQNKTPDAMKRYEEIVKSNQRAPVAANNLAWLMAEHGGNLDVALQHAQAAKVALPESPPINDTLGWIYYKKDLARQAIPPLELAASVMPQNPTYQLHLGLAYAKAGDKNKAQASLQRALKLNPKLDGADTARQTLASLATTGTN